MQVVELPLEGFSLDASSQDETNTDSFSTPPLCLPENLFEEQQPLDEELADQVVVVNWSYTIEYTFSQGIKRFVSTGCRTPLGRVFPGCRLSEREGRQLLFHSTSLYSREPGSSRNSSLLIKYTISQIIKLVFFSGCRTPLGRVLPEWRLSGREGRQLLFRSTSLSSREPYGHCHIWSWNSSGENSTKLTQDVAMFKMQFHTW